MKPFLLWLAILVVSLCASSVMGQEKNQDPKLPASTPVKPGEALFKVAPSSVKPAETPTKEAATQAKPGENPKPPLPSWAGAITARNLGPAVMGGRITALAVQESDSTTWWAATASGGLLKTSNNGTTFLHQFDREAVVSIGDVAVAPSNPAIVWVGTGENNPRNSVSWGDGVYKSLDGGKTWKNMGLKDSYQIGKVLIHPTDPNIVYVGALGRCWATGGDRGLFKTIDGGNTWKHLLFVDDRTGVIDMRMDPGSPDTLLVATWERRRGPFDSMRGEPPLPDGYDAYDPEVKWGPGSGLHKTTDGGATFRKIVQGLPDSHLGRIGIDWCRKDPKIVYAVVDCAEIGKGTPPKVAYLGLTIDPAKPGIVRELVADGPAAKAGLKIGDLLRQVDGKQAANLPDLQSAISGKKPGEKLKVAFTRDGKPLDLELILGERPANAVPGQGSAGGPASQAGTANQPAPTRFYTGHLGGQLENVQDQQGPNGHRYGGIYRSSDGGDTFQRVNSLNPRPMYFSQVRVDPTDPQRIYVLGVNLHQSVDGGKTFQDKAGNGTHPDHHGLWIDPRDSRRLILGNDGGIYVTNDRAQTWDFLNHACISQFYHVAVDNRHPYWVFGGLQDNGSWGAPSRVGRSGGPTNEDWISLNGGDGFVCRADGSDSSIVFFETQDGGVGRLNLKNGERGFLRPRDVKGQAEPNRFNWNTPYILSSFNSKIAYVGGNRVFRSTGPSDPSRAISPELSRTRRGTASALQESPLDSQELWVGTDDGWLWISRDTGATWQNLSPNILNRALPAGGNARWVSTIEPSRHQSGRCYVALDGHRDDDDRPLLLVTENFGQEWTSLSSNLPPGSTRVMREDRINPRVLYCGTEFGFFASTDRGANWLQVKGAFPTVAVHEVAQPERCSEIVLATHGRGVWILDASPIRQSDPAMVGKSFVLLKPDIATRWGFEPGRGPLYGGGNRWFAGENPTLGATIHYMVTRSGKEKPKLNIFDIQGDLVRSIEGANEAGWHRLNWDLRRGPPMRSQPAPSAAAVSSPKGSPNEGLASRTGPRRGNRTPVGTGGGPGSREGQWAPAGDYCLELEFEGQTVRQFLKVEWDSTVPVPRAELPSD